MNATAVIALSAYLAYAKVALIISLLSTSCGATLRAQGWMNVQRT